MAVKQTSVQKSRSIRFGSAKFEVSSDDITYVDYGAFRNVVFREEWDDVKVESDNAGRIKTAIANQIASIEGDLMEINLTNLNQMRGGIDLFTTQAGTPVAGATQTLLSGAWGYNDPEIVENQNSDLTQLTINSVTGGTDGLLVEDTDYFVGVNVRGETVITIIDSGTVTTEAQAMVIDYDYTPAATKTLKSGGLFTMADRFVRITNTDESGDDFVIKLFAATASEGIVIELQPDEGDDPAVTPIRMEGRQDEDLSEGEQLYEIVDGQNIT